MKQISDKSLTEIARGVMVDSSPREIERVRKNLQNEYTAEINNKLMPLLKAYVYAYKRTVKTGLLDTVHRKIVMTRNDNESYVTVRLFCGTRYFQNDNFVIGFTRDADGYSKNMATLDYGFRKAMSLDAALNEIMDKVSTKNESFKAYFKESLEKQERAKGSFFKRVFNRKPAVPKN